MLGSSVAGGFGGVVIASMYIIKVVVLHAGDFVS